MADFRLSGDIDIRVISVLIAKSRQSDRINIMCVDRQNFVDEVLNTVGYLNI